MHNNLKKIDYQNMKWACSLFFTRIISSLKMCKWLRKKNFVDVCRATCSLQTVVKIFQQPQQRNMNYGMMPHKNHETVLTFLTP